MTTTSSVLLGTHKLVNNRLITPPVVNEPLVMLCCKWIQAVHDQLPRIVFGRVRWPFPTTSMSDDF